MKKLEYNKDRIDWLLLIPMLLCMCFNFLDYIITLNAILVFGVEIELNPIMVYLFNWSLFGAGLIKVGVINLLFFLISRHADMMLVRPSRYKKLRKHAIYVYSFAATCLLLVVIWGIYQAIKAGIW